MQRKGGPQMGRAKKSNAAVEGDTALTPQAIRSRAIEAISRRGITSSRDTAVVGAAIIEDLNHGRHDSQVGNAVCNAMGKLLRIFEMEHQVRHDVPLTEAQDAAARPPEDGKFQREGEKTAATS